MTIAPRRAGPERTQMSVNEDWPVLWTWISVVISLAALALILSATAVHVAPLL